MSLSAFAQKREVELRRTDFGKLGRTKDGEVFNRLLGNVILAQNQTTIYCDSAYLFKNRNYVEAFGNVRITEGDSVTITGKKLQYDGNTRKAQLRQNVVFSKLGTATLYTEYLDFDRNRNLAYYSNGGKLVDSVNVLTSRKGYYNVTSNVASFKRLVTVTNPDYTMTSDSLQYNSRTKIIYFRTPTTLIKSDSSTFVYNSGVYDTRTKRSDILIGTGETQDYTLRSAMIDLDDLRKIYRFRGDVVMTHKKENLTIYGQAADHFKAEGISKVYDRAYVAKVTDDNDTLFITADTLVSIDSADPAKKRLLAYHNVKIFKKDLQGITDSLAYKSVDSTIFFYRDPVLWAQGNQMTADSISLLVKNNRIHRIFMNYNAFVISQDTIRNFNQIKGRKMTAEFKGKNVHQVIVEGNGESIYFVLEQNKIDSAFFTTGLNKSISSNIIIRFRDGRVNNLTFIKQPDANFIPPHELKNDNKKLKGFTWREKQRPLRKDVVKKQGPLPARTDRKRL